ncbi:succinate dehydrogenase assembly factor 2 [Tulasnella sp. 419]|nr:succinate dehydrogenase assembly factor 2 [Tulasnella sp. 419]
MLRRCIPKAFTFLPSRRCLSSTTFIKSADPYPLPLQSFRPSKQNDSSVLDNQDIPSHLMPKPLPRNNETVDTLRARLVYQSRKRGTLETDLLLSTFAKENLESMTESELKEFDKLMDEPDWDIYYWCTEKRDPPPRWANSPLLEKLRVHTRNEGKVVRKMPDL